MPDLVITDEAVELARDAVRKSLGCFVYSSCGFEGHYCFCRAAARAALTAASQAPPPARYRHRTARTPYTIVGQGKLQVSTFTPADNCDVTIYRDDNGSLWARATAEFNDGRFELLPSAPKAAP